MSHWPYANLNQFPSAASTSDGTGLLNGSDYSLSDYPSEALTAQLETWSNLTFDFDNNESAPFEEKLSGAYDDQGRLGGGRHGAEDRGGVFSFDQANQFQHLLLESTLLHSQSTLDPSLSLSSALPSTSTATFDHFSLPTLASLPPLAPIASTSTSPVSSSSTTGASKNKKVKLSKETVESGNATREGSVVTPTELDEDASIEDKRKRNTAASARFRIKKKQREAALEDSAKALKERVSSLEEELKTMKTENNWLRGLIMNPAALAGEMEKKFKESAKSDSVKGE